MQSIGSWTVLRGRKSPDGFKTKLEHKVCKSAALVLHSATFFSHFSLLEKKWCYNPEGIYIQPVLENIEARSFTFERQCLTNAENDETKLQQCQSCTERGLD